MYAYFEKLINPYPSDPPEQPPGTLFKFFWHYCRRAWGVLALMTLSIAVLSAIEVSLFGFMGNIVDWLGEADRETFLEEEGYKLALMVGVALLLIPGLGLINSLFVHQAILGNFGMIMRWQMHTYLLRQSMGFFADEFAILV